MVQTVARPAGYGVRFDSLPVHWEHGDPGQKVKVFGVVQEPAPTAFPDTLSGWYLVERWEKADPATALYVQVVVIVWNDPIIPITVPSRPIMGARLPIRAR